MLQALIFDFDGLILDTETPEYQSWLEIYQSYGLNISMARWATYTGIEDAFSPYTDLAALLGRPDDVERLCAEIRPRRRARYAELMAAQPLMPGVRQCLADAHRLGLKRAIASNSPHWEVSGYLAQYGIENEFNVLCCGDQVMHTKPEPDLYLAALRALNIRPNEAIAFEDSANGILAAKRAGLRCVAVPNPLTRLLSLDMADIQINSLAELSLEKYCT